MNIRVLSSVFAAAWTATALGGCSVYDHRYLYAPRPAEVLSPPDSGEELRTLVSVVGVRRADQESKLPACIEIRLLFENAGSDQVTVEPDSLVLTSAGLKRFPDPIIRPVDPIEDAPRDGRVVVAYFPFPDDIYPAEFDLSGLNLRWKLKVGDRSVTGSATFTRLPEPYYDRHRFHIGVGYHRWDC